MTRGRKKDLTIPAGRSLTVQRDYRARKAQYVADLEARCAAAEAENARLRQEIALLRAKGSSQATLPPAMIQASAQLRDTLIAASASLAHFMQVTLPEPVPADGENQMTTPSLYPVPAPLGSFSTAPAAHIDSYQHQNDIRTTALPEFVAMDSNRPSARPESPCCGGYIICEGLVEEEEDDKHQERDESDILSAAVSQIRSTGGR